MSVVEAKLQAKGLTLPAATAPIASYVPTVRTGNQLWVSGQIPKHPDGKFDLGKLGAGGLTLEQGQAAARVCVLNALAQIKAALGSLDEVERVIKVCVFVASKDGFTDQPKVANGASDLLVDVFGDAGKHARSAVGVAELPLGVCVEVEMVLEVKEHDERKRAKAENK